jgi:hypothetical protein
MSEPGYCEMKVYRRDTYRRTGRGKSGFSLWYNRGQCRRKAVICILNLVRLTVCRQHWAYLGYDTPAPPAGASEGR